jgi:hypothetical protein
VDEPWCDGVMMLTEGAMPDPDWLFAFDFQSGAVAAVAAGSAHASIQMQDEGS